MEAKTATEAAESLDKYAGPVTLIKGDTVTGVSELSEGDHVACKSGDGRQGIVQDITEGAVYVAHPSGGVRTYNRKSREYDDGDARFSLPGHPDGLHKLVKIN